MSKVRTRDTYGFTQDYAACKQWVRIWFRSGSMFSCIDCAIHQGAWVLTEPCTKAQFCIVWRKGYKSPIHLQCTCRASSGSGSRRWRGRWEWDHVSNPSDSTVQAHDVPESRLVISQPDTFSRLDLCFPTASFFPNMTYF